MSFLILNLVQQKFGPSDFLVCLTYIHTYIPTYRLLDHSWIQRIRITFFY